MSENRRRFRRRVACSLACARVYTRLRPTYSALNRGWRERALKRMMFFRFVFGL